MVWKLSKYENRDMSDQLARVKEALQSNLQAQQQKNLVPSAALTLIQEEQQLRKKIEEFEAVLLPIMKESLVSEKKYRKANLKAISSLSSKVKAIQKQQAALEAEIRKKMQEAHTKKKQAMTQAAEAYAETMKEAAAQKKKAA